MSANLDRSLDDLVGNRRKSGRRGGRRASASKPSTVGGVKKSTKSTKGTAKAAHPTPAATPSSKIIVSGLVCLPLISSAYTRANVPSLPM